MGSGTTGCRKILHERRAVGVDYPSTAARYRLTCVRLAHPHGTDASVSSGT